MYRNAKGLTCTYAQETHSDTTEGMRSGEWFLAVRWNRTRIGGGVRDKNKNNLGPPRQEPWSAFGSRTLRERRVVQGGVETRTPPPRVALFRMVYNNIYMDQ